MKSNRLLVALICCIMIVGCKKSNDGPKSTNLKFTVKDENGASVYNASVRLFQSQNDLTNVTNQVGSTAYTDQSGNVTIPNVSAIQYYWLVQNGCKNNLTGSVTSSTALTSGITNTADVTIKPLGALKFINGSTNPYNVYVNGTLAITNMAGGSTMYIYAVTPGSYTLRVIQQSGYVLTPTDKSYTGTVTCGSMLTTTFP